MGSQRDCTWILGLPGFRVERVEREEWHDTSRVRIPVAHDGTAGVANYFAGPTCELWGADGTAFDNANNL